MNEKERQSGEQERQAPGAPILPTVNPATEKPTQQPSDNIHPAVYIA